MGRLSRFIHFFTEDTRGRKPPVSGDWYTISGPIASFTTQLAAPVQSLKVSIEPVQSGSGDPSPDNVRPISGWDSVTVQRTGKDLLDISLSNRTLVTSGQYNNTSPRAFDKPYLYIGISANNYFQYSNVNSYSVSEKSVTVNAKTTAYGLGYTVKTKPGTTYTLGYKNKTVTTMGIGYYDADGNYLSFNNINQAANWTFTTPENCYNMIVVFRPTAGSDYTYEEPQLELGSTATPYEPYQGDTYTVSFGEAGTVYGGTLDVTTGELVVDRAMITGNLAWGVYWNGHKDEQVDTNKRATFFFSGVVGRDISSSFRLCNKLAWRSSITNGKGEGVGFYFHPTLANYVYVCVDLETIGLSDATSSTADDVFKDAFRTWAESLQICYTLATPITYQLTPTEVRTLLGVNNIWADTGDLEVTYFGDPPVPEPEESTRSALNILLGGAYRNMETPDDVDDEEALNILLGGR